MKSSEKGRAVEGDGWVKVSRRISVIGAVVAIFGGLVSGFAACQGARSVRTAERMASLAATSARIAEEHYEESLVRREFEDVRLDYYDLRDGMLDVRLYLVDHPEEEAAMAQYRAVRVLLRKAYNALAVRDGETARKHITEARLIYRVLCDSIPLLGCPVGPAVSPN